MTACSMKTAGFPNAASASRMQISIASGSAPGSSTRRMPRPPPPATAFTKTGKGSACASRTSAATSVPGATLCRVGTPAARAAAIARALFPVRVSTPASGPTNVMPAAAHASARAGFSDRKP